MDDDPSPAVAHYVLERYEDGDWAVLEQDGGATFTVPRAWLPDSAQEGDVLAVHKLPALSHYGFDDEPSSTLDIWVDEDETSRRAQAARSLRGSLPRGPEGDLEL